jgi:hypothetical protein
VRFSGDLNTKVDSSDVAFVARRLVLDFFLAGEVMMVMPHISADRSTLLHLSASRRSTLSPVYLSADNSNSLETEAAFHAK